LKKIILYSTFLLVIVFSQCKTIQQPPSTEPEEELPVIVPETGFQFIENSQLMPLLDQAEQEDKLVFIDFYTTWCLPCKLMDEDVYSDEDLGDFFNENFINFKVNGERGHGVNLVAIFEVTSYPTLLFLNSKGRIMERKNGAAYHSELRNLANNAILKAESSEGQ